MGLILFVVFLFIGCITTPVEYSYISTGQSASTIGFQTKTSTGSPSVKFISLDGRALPRAERNTHWDPIVFPSGRELRLIVHAVYEEKERNVEGLGLLSTAINTVQSVSAATRNVDINIEIIIPPLEEGKRYQLYFSKGAGIPGRNVLLLIDIATGNTVHEHEFIAIFSGLSPR